MSQRFMMYDHCASVRCSSAPSIAKYYYQVCSQIWRRRNERISCLIWKSMYIEERSRAQTLGSRPPPRILGNHWLLAEYAQSRIWCRQTSWKNIDGFWDRGVWCQLTSQRTLAAIALSLTSARGLGRQRLIGGIRWSLTSDAVANRVSAGVCYQLIVRAETA
jgi:hypothetical protein